MTDLLRRSPAAALAKPVDYQEVRLKPAPAWSHAVIWTIIGVSSLGFVYAALAKIDEVVVANGTLQAIGASRPIMSPVPGVVDQIEVREGQSVNAGDPLLRFDKTVTEQRQRSLQQQIRLEKQRFQEQERSYMARQESLESRTASLKASLHTENMILSLIEPLARQGGIQSVQVLEQKNKIQQLRSEIAQSQANQREVQAELLKIQQESLRNISELERQLAETTKISDYEILRAPLSGQVFGLKPSSPGYSAAANEVLLKIVPNGMLEAKVFLTNRDVGFARPGQLAQIRVDAYPFTQFGSLTGRLKAVGTDSLPPDQQNSQQRFPAYVSLDRLYLQRNDKRFKVYSGQTVSVNLIVRQKQVITLLTDSVQKALDSLRRIRSTPT